MELKIEKLEMINEPYTYDVAVRENKAFTVHVDDHRILTVTTHSNTVAARWLRQLLRCYHRKSTDKIVVGVCAERQEGYDLGRFSDRFYQLITICVGSQCLVYDLPERGESGGDPLPLALFFADPRVVAAGMNMKAVGEKLSRDHGIKFSNTMDLREGAEEVLERSYELDLRRYDLDRLATTVMGRGWFIERPYKVDWFVHGWHCGPLAMEKLMYATYDAYLCFSIGGKLLEMKREREKSGAGSAPGKKSNRKKKKGTNKN